MAFIPSVPLNDSVGLQLGQLCV